MLLILFFMLDNTCFDLAINNSDGLLYQFAASRQA
jgi:hypothetical protein